MYISQHTGHCPKCNSNESYGNVIISGARLTRRCFNCNYKEHIQLPKIEKKNLYLDQCFFSHAYRGTQDYISAFNKVQQLINKQP